MEELFVKIKDYLEKTKIFIKNHLRLITIATAGVLILCVLIGVISCPFQKKVVLVLVEKNGTKTEKVLTKYRRGEEVGDPSIYKIYPTLIDGYVVENDSWYLSEDMVSPVFFPYEMENHKLKLYGKVRPLKDVKEVAFASPEIVLEYFSANSKLKDDYITPSLNNDTSYYEISEYSGLTIKNILRYYPALNKIVLMRGFVVSESYGLSNVLIQEEFSVNVIIDLLKKEINCHGEYSRNGLVGNSLEGGTVKIIFDVPKISVDEVAPLVPNFATIKYSSQIVDSTNFRKLNELWESSGHEYSQKCYTQINTLLNSLNNKLLVLS